MATIVFVGIQVSWTPGMRYNLKISFAIKIYFNLISNIITGITININ